MDAFILRAALAGAGVACVAGVLGAFVVWRRMAYFGDATSHAALLGVALSLGFALPVLWGVVAVAALVAVLVTRLSASGVQGADTVLGVLAHGALAAGLVAVSFLPGARLDLDAYLFGDILTVAPADLWLIFGGGGVVLGVLAWRWQKLLTATVSRDLAAAEGIDPDRENLILALLLALTVALSIKAVGALLVTALLIIPAAAARPFSANPERMAALAAAIGVASAFGGIAVSWHLDTPTGPTIIVVSAVIYTLSRLRA